MSCQLWYGMARGDEGLISSGEARRLERIEHEKRGEVGGIPVIPTMTLRLAIHAAMLRRILWPA